MNQLIEPQTEAWRVARASRFTASEISDLIWDKKPTETAMGYIYEKVACNFLDTLENSFDTHAMRWGRENEPIAKEAYKLKFGVEIQNSYAEIWEQNPLVMVSPDGFILNEDCGIEIKCPETVKNHMKALLLKDQSDLKEYNKKYYWQCLCCMLVTGRKKWLFISFHPYFKEEKQLKVIEIHWNETEMQLLKYRIEWASKEYEQLYKQLK